MQPEPRPSGAPRSSQFLPLSSKCPEGAGDAVMYASTECKAEVTPSQDGNRTFSYTLEDHTKQAFGIMNELRLSQQLCDVTLQVKYEDIPAAQFMAHKALLRAVRCHALTPRFLQTQLQKCEILQADARCKDYLVQIFQELTLHKPTQSVPCRAPKVGRLIYTAGGYFRQSLSYLEAYNPSDGSWLRLADLQVPRSGLAGCVVGGLLYAVGGRNNSPDGNTDSNALDCYNPMTNQWSPCASMSVPRNRIGVGVIDGHIYAVGGSHGCIHHSSVERYEPDRDEWHLVAPMLTRRIGVGVAVLNRLLYAVGGFDGTNRLNSAECYYPERNEWRMITAMNTIRSGAGVCVLYNCIYAAGGYDGQDQLNSVERYDVETETWTFVAPMKHRRSALGITVHQGRIYVLGGYDGHTFLDSVECYDPDTDTWSEVTRMTSGRSGVGVAVTMEPCRKQIDQQKCTC
ncbi:kelch-like ECH-associated protein 1 [Cricetulus griseus]|uniref:Kelch-like ECH-associated protein 1 n=1 Tax=Cricetulus griseus TaxID=10029 RepID=A0A061I986_CRIGR|nr:kelch-like ECH-associated protein 1 [Cricetulus griseus]